jgi:hypothetical protein
LHPFAAVFRERTWQQAQVLLVGAMLASGQRTVTSAPRIMGLSHEPHFQNYHRVLNRATWSARRRSELLMLRRRAFVLDDAPIVCTSLVR